MPPLYLKLFLFPVAAMFSHAKVPFLRLELKGFCMQILCICINIHFDPFDKDDAVTWTKMSPERKDPSLAISRSRLWKT